MPLLRGEALRLSAAHVSIPLPCPRSDTEKALNMYMWNQQIDTGQTREREENVLVTSISTPSDISIISLLPELPNPQLLSRALA